MAIVQRDKNLVYPGKVVHAFSARTLKVEADESV